MNIQKYLEIISIRFKTGISREHTYRGDLQNLLMTLLPDILVTNEPAHISCGAPDYLLSRKDIPVGYIEAKDIGVDLNSKSLKEQFERYKAGLTNLIFTDYLQFNFYKEGTFITSVSLAKIEHGSIVPLPDNFATFESLIKNFVLTVTQSIKSPTRLAEMMAGKARLMADVILKSLDSDDENETISNLKKQMLSFKGMLIHDITNQGFADIYSQTIAYGLFAARYHDPTLEDFSRQEAANLIPKSNPFLRKLFQDIAGYDLDSRLLWIVEELISIFLASDVAKIMKNFGRSTKQEDPVVHFYETFLAAYNPALRKARGVWYTPQPVVNFIVRAVDDILRDEFNLPQGLADTSKTKIKLKVPTHDKRFTAGLREYEQEVHKVQILDPATGTGTFLAEVVKHIYKKFEGQQGIWSKYVNQHLIPRLNGFELLMASYAMAHLKMDMLLTETGYKATTDQRFKIFLTNSLEESHPDSGTLFSSWLSDEADQANAIKRDTPVMVIMGNPPYSGESANKSDWIMALMEDYKKEPGGKVKLKERNPKWINDDYVKFLRFGQHFIEKNGSGILAFINPHGFLDNPTFRGMRWNLLKTYDKIYIIDLHGNSKKKEVSPDGSIDANVFDIMQGVSLNIFIKSGIKEKDELAKVLHSDLFGKREYKYNFLNHNTLSSVDFKLIPNTAPMYFMVKKDFEVQEKYEKGFKINDLFPVNNVGVVTAKDAILINEHPSVLIANVKHKLSIAVDESLIKEYAYRPFENKFIYYDTKIVERAREKVMTHFTDNVNIGLIIGRQGQVVGSMPWNLAFITDKIIDFNMYYRGGGVLFPLWLYPTDSLQTAFEGKQKKIPNLNAEIISIISNSLSLKFNPDSEGLNNSPDQISFYPVDILDYIYAVLHSKKYREIYKEFLKIDFPRIPYPNNADEFTSLISLGKQLRLIHLLQAAETTRYITEYGIDGDNLIVSPRFELKKVYINDNQYFDNVPEVAWNFYIGGYQPAQKWLKDRKGRTLEFEDILHYQKIIVALTETARLMEEIDLVINI